MRKQEGYFVCADNMQPMLFTEQADAVRIEYRALLMEGEVECPPPDEDKEERKGKRGPIKRSKARNLLLCC
jgi:transposase